MWGWLVRRPAVGRWFRDGVGGGADGLQAHPRFGDGREEDADSRQLSLPSYSGFAMTREVWRLACSGVDLAMMCWRSYRLALLRCYLWPRHTKRAAPLVLYAARMAGALFCLRTLLNEGGVNRGHGGRAVEVDAVGSILLADGQLAGQALATARPQLGRGGEHHV